MEKTDGNKIIAQPARTVSWEQSNEMMHANEN